MKIFLLVLSALFPFLHATSYEVDIVDCQKDHIEAVSEGSELSLTLFNIHVKDEHAWNQACAILTEGEHVSMEIDPSAKIEEQLPVYIFVDGALLQEELLEKGLAYLLIRNPEYTYEKRMEAAVDKTTQTMARVNTQKKTKRYPLQGSIYLAVFFLIWIGMLLYLLHQKKRKTQKKKL